MSIPITYNLRNLVERKATTLMTALGIGLTVGVLVTALALVNGLNATFAGTGHPRQSIVLRKGGTAELNSSVSESAYQEIKLMPGIAKSNSGEMMASPELVSVINLPSVDSPSGMNVTVRGLLPIGLQMRDTACTQGRWFEPGHREVVVGESVAKRYQSATPGKRLRFGRGEWEVVGVFSGGQSAINSEIWCDLNQLRSDFNRQGDISSVTVRAQSDDASKAFIETIKNNTRLNAGALTEQEYFAKLTDSGKPLQILGMFVATIMAVGSGFGAMNTMYGAVARRGKEIGTFRALGFSRWSILTSFVLESVALSLLGGIFGCLLALPLNAVTTGVGSFKTFSEVAFNFRVGPSTIGIGLLFAAVIGLLGGLLPAWAASRRDLLTSLREG